MVETAPVPSRWRSSRAIWVLALVGVTGIALWFYISWRDRFDEHQTQLIIDDMHNMPFIAKALSLYTVQWGHFPVVPDELSLAAALHPDYVEDLTMFSCPRMVEKKLPDVPPQYRFNMAVSGKLCKDVPEGTIIVWEPWPAETHGSPIRHLTVWEDGEVLQRSTASSYEQDGGIPVKRRGPSDPR
jgi:hypothetical protein